MKEHVFFEKFDSLYYYHGSTQNWKMKGYHLHNQYEILLFLSEGAVMEVGNRSYQTKVGDLFLLNNKEYHRSIGAAGKDYNRYVLMFEEDILIAGEKALGYEFSKYFRNRPDNFMHKLHLNYQYLNEVEHKFKAVEMQINQKGSYAHQTKVALAILDLIMSINEKYEFLLKTDQKKESDTFVEQAFKLKKLSSQHERIEQIKKYVEDHITEKLEVDEIAKQFYISSYYLSHQFKKETGFTLLQYITNQKIMAAKGMLKKGYSVTDVAGGLSYNSDSHFISVFKKQTGITPKKYATEKNSKNV